MLDESYSTGLLLSNVLQIQNNNKNVALLMFNVIIRLKFTISLITKTFGSFQSLN